MDFEWDEAERQGNLIKRGIDVRNVWRLFGDQPVVTTRSSHAQEERFLTAGVLEGLVVTVIWTRRGGATGNIAVRRARDGGRRAFRPLFGGRTRGDESTG